MRDVERSCHSINLVSAVLKADIQSNQCSQCSQWNDVVKLFQNVDIISKILEPNKIVFLFLYSYFPLFSDYAGDSLRKPNPKPSLSV